MPMQRLATRNITCTFFHCLWVAFPAWNACFMFYFNFPLNILLCLFFACRNCILETNRDFKSDEPRVIHTVHYICMYAQTYVHNVDVNQYITFGICDLK